MSGEVHIVIIMGMARGVYVPIIMGTSIMSMKTGVYIASIVGLARGVYAAIIMGMARGSA
jgi:hypothetical protein